MKVSISMLLGECRMCHRIIRHAKGVSSVGKVLQREYSTVETTTNDTKLKGSPLVLLFPGQGTQSIGMFKNLRPSSFTQRAVNAASGILGFGIIDICNEGTPSEIRQTAVTQPAVFLSSVFAAEILKQTEKHKLNKISNIAGYSLGEITALYFSGCLTLENALRVIKSRSSAMQRASNLHKTGMLVLTGIRKEDVIKLCEAVNAEVNTPNLYTPVTIASYLHEKATVVGGTLDALEKVLPTADRLFSPGEVKGSRLDVSGAFHTPWMEPAQDEFHNALKQITFNSPQYPIYSNVTGQLHDPSESTIKRLLVEHLVEPVMWHSIMRSIYESSNRDKVTYELGPGNQLKSILSKIDKRQIRKFRNIDIADYQP